mmetsp:Transcript_23717/g.66604  ORF Transcript_23717/g.66604 Transcript_23717/m.66604 type:complete len:322 (+) Transcript_23717:80-1045(+)
MNTNRPTLRCYGCVNSLPRKSSACDGFIHPSTILRPTQVQQNVAGMCFVDEPPERAPGQQEAEKDAAEGGGNAPHLMLQHVRKREHGHGGAHQQAAHVRREVHQRQEASRDDGRHREAGGGDRHVPLAGVPGQRLVPGDQQEDEPGSDDPAERPRRADAQMVGRRDAARERGVETGGDVDEQPLRVTPGVLQDDAGPELHREVPDKVQPAGVQEDGRAEAPPLPVAEDAGRVFRAEVVQGVIVGAQRRVFREGHVPPVQHQGGGEHRHLEHGHGEGPGEEEAPPDAPRLLPAADHGAGAAVEDEALAAARELPRPDAHLAP